MDFWSELERELEVREQNHLRRQLKRVLDELLDLASNDYLGLSCHPEVVESAREAAAKFGAGARASRLVSGEFALVEELETELARFKDTESALVFSSGYAANVGVLTALANSETTLLCHKRNHASLIDGCRLASAQNGAQIRFWDSIEKLAALLGKTNSPRKIIVADAVFSMDGDLLNVPEVAKFAREFDAILVLDDAHGTGTLGEFGRGTTEHFQIHDERILTVGTLSKALGSQGGFVCGPRILREWLVNNARSFIYSTGLNPPAVGAALASLQILQREPQRVEKCRHNTRFLAEELQKLGFDARLGPTPILPVVVGEADAALELSRKLESRGLWCPAIRPPTVPVGAARLRIGVRADWDEANLQQILDGFKN